MKGSLLAGIAVLVVAGTAAASTGQPVPWTKPDMTTAVKALGYPKPHARKVTCKGLGVAANGRYVSFRCAATYAHKRVRRFYTAGRGEGGWLCAGKTVAGCTMLRHGFVSTSEVGRYYGLAGYAKLASIGYLQNHGDASPTSTSPCAQAGTLSWACGYDAGTVTITYKTAKGGWTIAGTG